MNEYDRMCEDVNKHGQPIFTVHEIQFTYFGMFSETRTVPYPPSYEELDNILIGWEGLTLSTGCYIREWSLSDTEFVAALLDQNEHIISCIYVRGTA